MTQEEIEEIYLKYFIGLEDEAHLLKFEKTPKNLYRFVPCDDRLNHLEDGILKFNNAEGYDDPYDMLGICWDVQKLSKEFLSLNSKRSIPEFDNFFPSVIERNKKKIIKSICFSENLYCIPLWITYANNFNGFVLQYDFTSLGAYNKTTASLWPILYRKERIDVTDALLVTMKNKKKGPDSLLEKIFAFHLFVKHESWKFQDEWRIIAFEGLGEPDLSIKPTAIYSWENFAKDKQDILKEKSKTIGCEYFKITAAKNSSKEFFQLLKQ